MVYRDWATDTVGAQLGSTDSAASAGPRPSTSADRESASAVAEKDNLGDYMEKPSEGNENTVVGRHEGSCYHSHPSHSDELYHTVASRRPASTGPRCPSLPT